MITWYCNHEDKWAITKEERIFLHWIAFCDGLVKQKGDLTLTTIHCQDKTPWATNLM